MNARCSSAFVAGLVVSYRLHDLDDENLRYLLNFRLTKLFNRSSLWRMNLISKSKLTCRSQNLNYPGNTDLRRWSWNTIDASRDRSCLPAVDMDVETRHEGYCTTGIKRRITLCVANTSVTRGILCNRSAIGPVSGLPCVPRQPAVIEIVIQEENPVVPPFFFLPAYDLMRPYALRSPRRRLRDVISWYVEEWERKSEWEEGAEGDRGEERGSRQDRNSISSSSWHLSTFLSL